MRLDVRKSPVLQALIVALASVPNDVAKEVRQRSKSVIVPEFRRGLAERAPAEKVFHDRLVAPSTAYVSDKGVKLIGGANGMFPRETEFGAYRETFVDYTRKSRKGGTHKVHRRVQRAFWHYTKNGRVFYPTLKDLIPRIGALWTQTAVRTIAENTEEAIGRGR